MNFYFTRNVENLKKIGAIDNERITVRKNAGTSKGF